jgi:hypothetical protein
MHTPTEFDLQCFENTATQTQNTATQTQKTLPLKTRYTGSCNSKLKTLLLKLKKHCHSKHATLAAATQTRNTATQTQKTLSLKTRYVCSCNSNSKHCYSSSKNTATQNTLHWQLQLKLKTLLLKLKKHCHSKHTTLTDEPPSAAGGG